MGNSIGSRPKESFLLSCGFGHYSSAELKNASHLARSKNKRLNCLKQREDFKNGGYIMLNIESSIASRLS